MGKSCFISKSIEINELKPTLFLWSITKLHNVTVGLYYQDCFLKYLELN